MRCCAAAVRLVIYAQTESPSRAAPDTAAPGDGATGPVTARSAGPPPEPSAPADPPAAVEPATKKPRFVIPTRSERAAARPAAPPPSPAPPVQAAPTDAGPAVADTAPDMSHNTAALTGAAPGAAVAARAWIDEGAALPEEGMAHESEAAVTESEAAPTPMEVDGDEAPLLCLRGSLLVKRKEMGTAALHHVLTGVIRTAERASIKRQKGADRRGTANLMVRWRERTQEANIDVTRSSAQFWSNRRLTTRLRKAARQLRADNFLVGRRSLGLTGNVCRRCMRIIHNNLHPRLACPAMSDFCTASHDRLVQLAAEAVRSGPNPPTYLWVSAGSKEGPGSLNVTIPSEILEDCWETPDLVAVWVQDGAWYGPGTPVLIPSGIRIHAGDGGGGCTRAYRLGSGLDTSRPNGPLAVPTAGQRSCGEAPGRRAPCDARR